MADYQDIRGLRVKYLSADPSVTVPGEVWYNSTTGTLRSRLVSSAWSSSSPLTTARNGGGGFGIQTAGVFAGGYIGPTPYSNATEEYNGSGWSNGGNIGTAREAMAGGAGTLTAGLIAGGYLPAPTSANTDATEEYDGSSWTAGGVLGTPRRYTDVIGTQTAALACGGFLPPGTNATEEYGGTSWTAGGNMNVSSHNRAGAGTQSAAWIAGKEPTGGETELYDGSSWTAVNALNTGRQAAAASGITTAGLYFGGNSPSPSTNVLTEEWDGTDWSVAGALGTAIANAGSATQGTISASLAMGGNFPTGATQEFNRASTVITPGAWAAGGALTMGRNLGNISGGTQTASLAYAGYQGNPPAGNRTSTESYDGTTWSPGGAVGTGRRDGMGVGPQTAALLSGGYSTAPTVLTEEYNGSVWAVQNVAPLDLASGAGGAAAAYGWNGTTGADYDGTNWTAGATLPAAMNAGCGTSTVALAAAPPPSGTTVLEYNSPTWTAGGTMNTGRANESGMSGIQTSAVMAGAAPPTIGPITESYDGTSWSTAPNQATGRNTYMASAASGTTGLIAGGTTDLTSTEEFTGETTAANYKTITTS